MRRRITKPTLKSRLVTALATTCLCMSSVQPAHAIFGFGDIVLDPINLVQNISTATNTLRQISMQIQQLRNEALSLINEAKNLASFNFNIQYELSQVMSEISQLMAAASAITYEINQTKRAFETTFPKEYSSWSNSDIALAADTQMEMSRASFEDAMLVQSKVVQSVQEDTTLLTNLVSRSQTAQGDLSAVQAGNQIIALGTKQSMQMQELMVAQYRAESIERARVDAVQRESKVLGTRFIGSRTAY